jgi:hypothetical protein
LQAIARNEGRLSDIGLAKRRPLRNAYISRDFAKVFAAWIYTDLQSNAPVLELDYPLSRRKNQNRRFHI